MKISYVIGFGGITLLLLVGAFRFMQHPKYTENPRCPDCNILMVVIDPLRYDTLSPRDNLRIVAPLLDDLIKQGVTFTNAVAASSWTLPSAMSLLTGTYPEDHGIINKELLGKTKDTPNRPARLADEAPGIVTLAQELKRSGYVTGGFAGGAALEKSYGFDRGFDEYESPGDFHDIASSSAKAIMFAERHKDEKMFVLLHGFDVHGQYDPPGGLDRRYVGSYGGTLTGSTGEQKLLREEGVFEGRVHLTKEDVTFLRAIYDEKVARLDARLKIFFDEWKSLRLPRDTIIVFTSDHGDEFYEHGRIDHGMTLFDEVIHVPLVLIVPGVTPGKISQQVRTVDIAPTILALLGLSPGREFASQLRGVSLVPMLQGKKLFLDALSQTSYRYAVFRDAVRGSDGVKLIKDKETGTDSIFDVKKDPGESVDLAGQNGTTESVLNQKLIKMTSL